MRTADRGLDPDGDGELDAVQVDLTVVVSRPGIYAANARIIDATGRHIDWAGTQRMLAAGEQTLQLAFNGRMIYGNGVDGPYRIVDLSIYQPRPNELHTVDHPLVLTEVHQTAPYAWNQFEEASLVVGHVTANGLPVPGAVVAMLGFAYDSTDAAGAYRLGVLAEGEQIIGITGGQWRIYLNGSLLTTGATAEVPIAFGQRTTVDFVSAAGDLAGTGSKTVALVPVAFILMAGGSGLLAWAGSRRRREHR